MASTELSNVRILLCIKTTSEWDAIKSDETKILMKGEIGINADTGQFKIGTGVASNGTWEKLPYVNIGANYETSITNMVKNLIEGKGDNKSIYNLLIQLIEENSVTDLSTIAIESGDANGSIKYTTDGTNYTEVKITGLGTAAFKNTGNKQGDILAIGTSVAGKENYPALIDVNGAIKPGSSTIGSMAYKSTKDYYLKEEVDNKISKDLSAVDAMIYKGVIGTNNPLPTRGIKVGDTYKIVTPGTYAGYKKCEIGDMLIALVSSAGADGVEKELPQDSTTWSYIPSGNESEISTDILVSGSKTLILNGNFS